MNAEIAVLLTSVDTSTLVIAVERGDRSLIRMTDGTAPTDKQLALIMDAGPGEFVAAQSLMQHSVEIAREQLDAASRLRAIALQYALDSDETAEDLLPRMPAEDREEFLRLLEVVAWPSS